MISRSKTAGAALALATLLAVPTTAAAEPASSITLTQAIEEGARGAPPVVETSRTREAAVSFARSPGSALPTTPQVTGA